MIDFPSPDIEILQGRTPDVPEADTFVVIDVLRAFTTTHVALQRGASHIVLAESVEEARERAAASDEHLLAGERNARRIEGFDAGNSPHEFSSLELAGRSVVLTTTNGVRATTHVVGAGDVLVTGWSNAPATLDYLRRAVQAGELEQLVLVASHPVSDEDVACAEYIEGSLLGRNAPTPEEVLRRIRRARSAQKFQSSDDWSEEDLEIALQRRAPEFAMRVEMRDGVPVVTPDSIEDEGE